jgi:hypothetical protein
MERPMRIGLLTPLFVWAVVPALAQSTGDAWPQYEVHNGAWYRVEKRLEGQEEVKLFHGAGGVFTREQLRAHVAAQAPRVIADELAARIAKAGTAPLEVLVVLSDQPAGPLSREVFGRIREEDDRLSEAMRAISARAAGPRGAMVTKTCPGTWTPPTLPSGRPWPAGSTTSARPPVKSWPPGSRPRWRRGTTTWRG